MCSHRASREAALSRLSQQVLAGEADVVVCCAMLDGGSHGLFDAEVLGAARPGSVFVNVARGGLVDEAALLRELDSGRIAGAALDVFATEPADPQDALLRHAGIIATPHIAGVTTHMLARSAQLFAENLQRWAGGEPPRWAVNAPAKPRRPND